MTFPILLLLLIGLSSLIKYSILSLALRKQVADPGIHDRPGLIINAWRKQIIVIAKFVAGVSSRRLRRLVTVIYHLSLVLTSA